MSLPSKGGPDDARHVDQSIASAQHGSYAALGQLFDLYRDYLLRVANSELQSDLVPKVAPSDVVQETFLHAAREFHNFRGTSDGELKAWLRQILIHSLRDTQRRHYTTQKRDVALEVRLLAAGSSVAPLPPLASPSPTPSQCAVTAEMHDVIQAALRKLPADYAQVIELRTFAGLPFDQVGEVLGRSGEAVRKLWGRAIERLASELASYDSEQRRPI